LYRSICEHLKKWKKSTRRKVLLLRGARQVGKTWATRELAKDFKYFCEINFEENRDIISLFKGSLDPQSIVSQIEAYTKTPIQEGKTLLFFDEIQECPDALRSLRFFQEKLPKLHVVAAGSLLEFALSEIPSFGVGRIQSLFMYPMSFKEFLNAQGESHLIDFIQNKQLFESIPEVLFDKLVANYKTYMMIGGFPEVVEHYRQSSKINECLEILDELIQSFRDDFSKYKKRIATLRIDEVFTSCATQAGGKFKYSQANPNLPAYQVKDTLELLILAGLVHKVYHSSAQGSPLNAQVNHKRFKVIPCDIGLYQRLTGGDISELVIAENNQLINKGAIAEIITGTELLAYSSPKKKSSLYYWHRESRASNAEVDYLIEFKGEIIPIEVKAGSSGKMQSLRLFLETHQSPYGIRTSMENFAEYDNIKVIPAFALFLLFP
jgi:uncharacterized protein